jgi:hypothetical protein
MEQVVEAAQPERVLTELEQGLEAKTPKPVSPKRKRAVKAAKPEQVLPPALYQLSTPYQLAKRYQAITLGQIRWAIFHEEENGLAESGAITRFGRRILIDEVKFVTWLFSKGTAK